MATNSYMVVHQHPEAQIQTANTPTSLENRDTVTAHLSVAKRSETVPGSCEWTLALCTTLLKGSNPRAVYSAFQEKECKNFSQT